MINENIGILELDLIRRAKTGDGSAFSLLVKAYLKRVYGAAYSFVRNTDDASDVSQEVFFRAFRSIRSFDETRPFYPWLHRITRNLSLNHLRRKNGRTQDLEHEDMLPDTRGNPEQTYIKNENASDIERAIASLPEQYREIIVLKHYQDCTYAEMAEILSIPMGTVMSRLYNARVKLREILKEQEA